MVGVVGAGGFLRGAGGLCTVIGESGCFGVNNCSIVPDDIGLTIVCPPDFTVLLPASFEDEEAVEIIVEESSDGRVVVAAVVTDDIGLTIVCPPRGSV